MHPRGSVSLSARNAAEGASGPRPAPVDTNTAAPSASESIAFVGDGNAERKSPAAAFASSLRKAAHDGAISMLRGAKRRGEPGRTVIGRIASTV